MRSGAFCVSWALTTCAQAAGLGHPMGLSPQDYAHGYRSSPRPKRPPTASHCLWPSTREPCANDLGDLAVFNARGEVVPSSSDRCRPIRSPPVRPSTCRCSRSSHHARNRGRDARDHQFAAGRAEFEILESDAGKRTHQYLLDAREFEAP